MEAQFVERTASWMRSIRNMPRPQLPSRLERLIEERNWPAAFELVAKVKGKPVTYPYRPWHQITLGIEMLLNNPDVEDWPRLLSMLLEFADNPSSEPRLRPLLVFLHSLGLRVFDNDAARTAFDALPDQVQIFRGTVEAESTSGDYGLCWTLNREIALLFARFQPYRYADSSAAILSCSINREDIVGIFLKRGHEEVMICPERLRTVEVEPLPNTRIALTVDELTEEDHKLWGSWNH